MEHFLTEEQAPQYSVDARLNYIGVDIGNTSEEQDDKRSQGS
jgi:hypothetical protein